MLLSDKQVGKFLGEHFVLCWHSVHAVPKVTIDFGNGRVLERTLKGNTAFHILRSDGSVVDSLPGVMQPESFLAALKDSLEMTGSSDDQILQSHRLAGFPQPQVSREAMLGKGLVEAPLLKALEPERLPRSATVTGGVVDVSAQPATRDQVLERYVPGAGRAGERTMKADSEASLKVLRPEVHRLFSRWSRLPSVEEFRGPLYKEVLKVDLDDPYLGLKIEDIPGT